MKFIAKGNRQLNFSLNEKGKLTDISITPGGESVELPEDNSFVKDLEFKGHIEKVVDAAPASAKTK